MSKKVVVFALMCLTLVSSEELEASNKTVLKRADVFPQNQPSFMSKIASWIFPFGGSGGDSVASEAQHAGGQYLPANQNPRKEDCNPCNKEPWIPVATNYGKNTIIGFMHPNDFNQGQVHHQSFDPQTYGPPLPNLNGNGLVPETYGVPNQNQYGAPVQKFPEQYGPPLQNVPPPQLQDQYGPPPQKLQDQYGAPPQKLQDQYGSPPHKLQDQYGAPPQKLQDQYGPPPQKLQDQYGAPPQKLQDQYGPPPQKLQDQYGAPPQKLQEQYGVPPQNFQDQYGPPPQLQNQHGSPPQVVQDQYGPPPQKLQDQYGTPVQKLPDQYGPPILSNGPPLDSYGAPLKNLGKPYGPPSPTFGPPPFSSYGPPKQHYPAPKPYFGPNKHQKPRQVYGAPSQLTNQFRLPPPKFAAQKLKPSTKFNFPPTLSTNMRPPPFTPPLNFIPLHQPNNFKFPNPDYVPPRTQLPLSQNHPAHLLAPIPLPNLSPYPVVPLHEPQPFRENNFNGVQNSFNGGGGDVQIQQSIAVADYVASIEHPINVIRSPIVDLNVANASSHSEDEEVYRDLGGANQANLLTQSNQQSPKDFTQSNQNSFSHQKGFEHGKFVQSNQQNGFGLALSQQSNNQEHSNQQNGFGLELHHQSNNQEHSNQQNGFGLELNQQSSNQAHSNNQQNSFGLELNLQSNNQEHSNQQTGFGLELSQQSSNQESNQQNGFGHALNHQEDPKQQNGFALEFSQQSNNQVHSNHQLNPQNGFGVEQTNQHQINLVQPNREESNNLNPKHYNNLSDNPIIVDDAHAAASSHNGTIQKETDLNAELINQIIKGVDAKQFTQPALDYGDWSPNQELSTEMIPPPQGESYWSNTRGQGGSEHTTKKPKQIQIIIPYTTNSNSALLNFNQGRKVPNLPLFTQPPSHESVWSDHSKNEIYKTSESQEVTVTNKPTTQVINIKDLLKSSHGEVDYKNLPFDIIRFQKNIDGWTEQEYANKMLMHLQKATSTTRLVPSKKIPDEYLTTQPYNFKEIEVTTQYPQDFFDHEPAGTNSKEYHYKDEIDSNLIAKEITEIHLPGLTTERQRGKPNWDKIQIAVSPLTKEKVYVVTPQPKLNASTESWRNANLSTTFSINILPMKNASDFNDVRIVLSEWPHLINNLATTTSTSPRPPTSRHPLFGLMDLSSYAPPENSTIQTYSGHSKVINAASSGAKKKPLGVEEKATIKTTTQKNPT